MKLLVIIFISLLSLQTAMALDVTKMSLNYDKSNCVDFLGIKDNLCDKNTNVSISFPAQQFTSPCKEFRLKLTIGENTCWEYFDFNERFINNSFASCNINLKEVFEKACKSTSGNDYLARIGDGLDRDWNLEINSNNGIILKSLSLRIVQEQDVKDTQEKLKWQAIAIVITFLATIISFIFAYRERKQHKKAIVLLFLGIFSLIVTGIIYLI
jgi:hypothetical protein